MAPVILASSSPYRRMLLERLAAPFSTEAPGVDEDDIAGERPAERAQRLAAAKALAVARRHPEAVVIGSDQVAAAGELVLEKPATLARAREQLAALSGAEARFYTACAISAPGGFGAAHLDETRVRFRSLSAQEIERYVIREQPLDCAGGFKAESLGIALFERIESSDPTALIGLPLIWVASVLRRLGCAVP
ncbi:MAG TPA: Maf family nucleotide pyrophosphatase [Steroidobacteraceae bacterium]|nr:Maf family nucleotide pyrophosphatase [Steroidobacteraceae bacterium]